MITEIQLQNFDGVITRFGPREIYVLESIDWGVASINNKTIFYFPSEIEEEILAYNWNPRNIQIVGYVVAPSEEEILQASQELTDFIGVQKEIKILYNGFHLTFFATGKVRFAIDENNDNEVLRKFQITGVCIDPLWKGNSDVLFQNGNTIPMFSFPLSFNQSDTEAFENNTVIFGRTFTSREMFVNFDGNFDRGVRIHIHAETQIRDITIQQIRGNITEHFTLLGTYLEGSEILIDTRDGHRNVFANGIDVTNNVTLDSVWLRIHPGQSFISFFYSATQSATIMLEVKQDSVFEVQA